MSRSKLLESVKIDQKGRVKAYMRLKTGEGKGNYTIKAEIKKESDILWSDKEVACSLNLQRKTEELKATLEEEFERGAWNHREAIQKFKGALR